ncbi:LysR family transcriptional regulator [Brachybacterium sp. MASK1Z-5]|uniref:LysR family transcriptional regulator n=1 Tax=Brachybacterium halotolerans TaxID=2795215 RepID=A0ABS1B921_9MICO|nr:LysR substrate-binding domain-containing protein [Brachybacterium halotolerans]MBK0331109.1 LysR family transcriptional regulator [Brachybacterium halotolerans]
MRIDHLQAFDAAARQGTFTRAAEELFLTQPSFSRKIAGLEAELGAALFDRGRGGAALTAAGEALLPIARRILADERSARRTLDELAGLRRGLVRIGAPPTLCVSLVADVLAAFHARHPEIELHVLEAGAHTLTEALEAGDLDLALTVTREDRPGADGARLVADEARLVPLLREELVVVATAQRPHDGTTLPDEVTLAELAALPQVAFNRSYELRASTDAAFAAHGLTPRIAVEGAEMDAVLRFVERGIGVAVVPAMVVRGRAGLRSARLVLPALERTVNLALRRDAQASAAAAAMHEMVLASVPAMAGSGVVPLLP